ncbi:hypothetical protein NDU88_006534 [Pleurodeles waltl]|uniref:Uncharacterized protein n=1 Tax=Pleurodeles waltl TaxID=8319 RepID=A0AAV7NQG8_PLEWA|nr:hypothetical protein NDU88_006534 [Pleurodeles waltl]
MLFPPEPLGGPCKVFQAPDGALQLTVAAYHRCSWGSALPGPARQAIHLSDMITRLGDERPGTPVSGSMCAIQSPLTSALRC